MKIPYYEIFEGIRQPTEQSEPSQSAVSGSYKECTVP